MWVCLCYCSVVLNRGFRGGGAFYRARVCACMKAVILFRQMGGIILLWKVIFGGCVNMCCCCYFILFLCFGLFWGFCGGLVFVVVILFCELFLGFCWGGGGGLGDILSSFFFFFFFFFVFNEEFS